MAIAIDRRRCVSLLTGSALSAAILPSARASTAAGLLLSFGVLSLFAAMNRTQDIAALAARVAQTAGPAPLLLWSPDETTLAWAQLELPAGSWRAIDGAEATAPARLIQQLRAMPATVVVSMVPGSWQREAWLAYLRGELGADGVLAAHPGSEPLLGAAGLRVHAQVGRPGGRGYFLWRRAD